MARPFHSRRDGAAQLRMCGDRRLGRRRFRRDGVSRGQGARPRERASAFECRIARRARRAWITRSSSSTRWEFSRARSTSAPAVDGYLSQRAGRRWRTTRQRDGAHAHDHAVRSRREASRHSARHGQQDGAPVRLLHLARRRLAADQPARRSVQDAGVGARRVTSACPT